MKLEQIKSGIAKLTPEQFEELSLWLRNNYTEILNSPGRTQAISKTNQEKGDAAETYIAALVLGVRMPPRAPFDVRAGNGKHLEVKFSKLSTPRGAAGTAFNWTWARPLGANRDKKFDRLILVAEPNTRCANQYKETACRYVLFDIPAGELASVMDVKNNQIVLNSNPSVISLNKEKLVKLYGFQVTSQQVHEQYSSL